MVKSVFKTSNTLALCVVIINTPGAESSTFCLCFESRKTLKGITYYLWRRHSVVFHCIYCSNCIQCYFDFMESREGMFLSRIVMKYTRHYS